MPKVRKKTGDIFEISLQPYFDLFAYFKYIDITLYDKAAKYPDIIRVFDFISDMPVDSIQKIPSRKLFLNPIYISGGYGVVKKFRYVGWEAPQAYELNFPYLRRCVPDEAEERGRIIEGWDLISPDCIVVNRHPLDYSSVKHLDTPGLIINIDYLAYRISLEIFKKESKNIEDKFELDWYQKHILKRVNEMPIFNETVFNAAINLNDR